MRSMTRESNDSYEGGSRPSSALSSPKRHSSPLRRHLVLALSPARSQDFPEARGASSLPSDSVSPSRLQEEEEEEVDPVPVDVQAFFLSPPKLYVEDLLFPHVPATERYKSSLERIEGRQTPTGRWKCPPSRIQGAFDAWAESLVETAGGSVSYPPTPMDSRGASSSYGARRSPSAEESEHRKRRPGTSMGFTRPSVYPSNIYVSGAQSHVAFGRWLRPPHEPPQVPKPERKPHKAPKLPPPLPRAKLRLKTAPRLVDLIR